MNLPYHYNNLACSSLHGQQMSTVWLLEQVKLIVWEVCTSSEPELHMARITRCITLFKAHWIESKIVSRNKEVKSSLTLHFVTLM